MELLCAVSLGEVLDKVSVLRIKQARIKDPAKLQHVHTELDRLTTLLGDISQYETFLNDLTKYNTIIWDVEDELRAKEKLGQFDAKFVELARAAYLTNDKRFAVKSDVNQKYHSAIQEQKSYDA